MMERVCVCVAVDMSIGRPKINAEVTTKGPSLLQGLQHLDAYLGYFCTSVN